MVKKAVFTMVALLNCPLWADNVQVSSVTTPPSVAASTIPAVAQPVAPAVSAPRPLASRDLTVAMNEMTGTVESVSSDPQVLRLTVDGGYNVEFTYDSQTTATNGGHDLVISDLNYGDKVVVRYIGRDLVAREVERISRAVPPAIASPESPTPSDSNPPGQPAAQP
jgi:hypothetical protein